MKFGAIKAIGLSLIMGVSTLSMAEETPVEPVDPWEGFNRAMYNFNDGVDRIVMKPVAEGYTKVVPKPARTGVSNFFDNLQSPMVIFNDLLQGKIQQSIRDTLRFIFNTTFGLGGILDVATPMNLEQHDEDFGQTLGYWGVNKGNYLVLPLLGPSTVRDTVGLAVDSFADPVYYLNPDRDRYATIVARAIDKRARLLGASRVLEVGALDPYEFARDAYLQRRNNQVLDGNVPEPEFYDEMFEEDEALQ